MRFQRYIIFGAIAGILSGIISALSGIWLPFIVIPVTTVSAVLVGLTSGRPIARY